MLRTQLDMVLGSLLWLTLLEQGAGLDDLQGCIPSSTTLWFCNSPIRNYWWGGGSFNASNPNQRMLLSSWKALHLTFCSVNQQSYLGSRKPHMFAEMLGIVFHVKCCWKRVKQQTALVVYFSFSSCGECCCFTYEWLIYYSTPKALSVHVKMADQYISLRNHIQWAAKMLQMSLVNFLLFRWQFCWL